MLAYYFNIPHSSLWTILAGKAPISAGIQPEPPHNSANFTTKPILTVHQNKSSIGVLPRANKSTRNSLWCPNKYLLFVIFTKGAREIERM